MTHDPQLFITIAERLGVSAAAFVMVFLFAVWLLKLHRAERAEWRQAMEAESILNRRAVGELRKGLSELHRGLNELAESLAFLDGKISGKAKTRRK